MKYLVICVSLSLIFWGCSGDDSDAGDTGGQAGMTGGSAGMNTGGDAGEAGETGEAGTGGMAGDNMGGSDGGEEGGMAGEAGSDMPPPRGTGDADEGEPQPYEVPASLSAPTGPDPAAGQSCDSYLVSQIQGWIVDRIGRPVADAKAQLCIVGDDGNTNCLRPSDSAEDGTFTITIPADYQCIGTAAFRVIKPGSGRAPMYCNADLSSSASDSRVVFADPFVLYAAIAPAELPPMGDERASRTVAFQNGAELDVIPFDLVSDYAELGVRSVSPDERGLCFIPEDNVPTRLFAFSPDSTIYGDPATFRLPNEDELAPGTSVELYLLGGLGCEQDGEHIAEAAWHPLGNGTVSEDGAHIVPEEGLGISCLTWLGYRVP